MHTTGRGLATDDDITAFAGRIAVASRNTVRQSVPMHCHVQHSFSPKEIERIGIHF
jgi:hypothetical protein